MYSLSKCNCSENHRTRLLNSIMFHISLKLKQVLLGGVFLHNLAQIIIFIKVQCICVIKFTTFVI